MHIRIQTAINVFKRYVNERTSNEYSSLTFQHLITAIYDLFGMWKGETYIGEKKETQIEEDFQKAFVALVLAIETLDHVKDVSTDEVELIKALKYSGTIYRYLGSCNHNNKQKIKPEYSDIYVSWSLGKAKCKERKGEEPWHNDYFEEKLYGPMTVLTACIPESKFGLNVYGFNEFYDEYTHVSHLIDRDEYEIIYPTIKADIIRIQVITYSYNRHTREYDRILEEMNEQT